MKTNRFLLPGALATAVLSLAFFAHRAQAQNENLNTGSTETYATLKFGFPTTGPSEGTFNDPTWNYWYSILPGNNTPMSDDATTAYPNNTPGANTSNNGSLEVVIGPWVAANQEVWIGAFSDQTWGNFTELADLTTYASIDFDILVKPGNALDSTGDYGQLGTGCFNTSYSYQQIDTVTIPSSAASGWVHLSVPIPQDIVGGPNLSRFAAGIGFQQSTYNSPPYPAPGTTTTYWMDNITLVPLPPVPIPPPRMLAPAAAVPGFNSIWAVAGSSEGNMRYQLCDTNDAVDGNDSFYGQSSVTYSWTIGAYPSTNTAAQAHFFIVNGPDTATGTTGVIANQYDQAVDYNFQNCIFTTVQSDGAGNGIMNLRWKTNDGYANDQLFNTNYEPYLSITDTPLLGTWSLKVTGGNVFTLTGPSGVTASYTMPSAAAAEFSEANGPCSFVLGSAPNGSGSGAVGSDVVFTKFSRTGNHAFTDNFATDTTLNLNNWEYYSGGLGAEVPGAVLVPPTATYWAYWTLPALNYAPLYTSSLQTPFAQVAPIAQFQDGTNEATLIATPAGNAAYFQVVQRKFSQLVVVLPGQTFTPGVAPGYSGTPTPVDVSDTGLGEEDIAVYAVDSSYYPVPGVTDNISVPSSTDGSAVRPTGDLAMAPAAQNANWSVALFNVNSGTGAFYFVDTPGPYTITVQDDTTQPQGSPAIPNATSAPVVTN